MSIVSSAWPFSVRAVGWHPRRGHVGATIVAKVAYDLQPGASPFADRHEELLAVDVASPHDPPRIWKPADCAPFKRQAEVLVVIPAPQSLIGDHTATWSATGYWPESAERPPAAVAF